MSGAMTAGRRARPLLKVCGVTDAATAIGAAALGVDFIGMVFADGSPRKVSAGVAVEIAESVRRWRRASGGKAGPRLVGVFAGAGVDEIIEVARTAGLDIIQLHGEYGADAVAALKASGHEVWLLAPQEPLHFPGAGEDAVLIDGRDGRRAGGTGRQADWGRVAAFKAADRRVVLAGGLSASNIRAAASTGADILDVNSGVETAPGRKDIGKVAAVVAALQSPGGE